MLILYAVISQLVVVPILRWQRWLLGLETSGQAFDRQVRLHRWVGGLSGLVGAGLAVWAALGSH